MKKPNAKERLFIESYCCYFNGSRAAIEAGYSSKSAKYIAYELLEKPHIALAIERRLHEVALKFEELRRVLVTEYKRIALANPMCNIMSFDSVEDIPPSVRPYIKKVKCTRGSSHKGDYEQIEVEFYDKLKAMDSLAKITGLMVEVKKDVGESYETLLERVMKAEAEKEAREITDGETEQCK